jgi:hypothetical protein
MNDIINQFIDEICYISTDYEYIPTKSDIIQFCNKYHYDPIPLLEWLKLMDIEREFDDCPE